MVREGSGTRVQFIEHVQTVTKQCLHGPSNQIHTHKSEKHT